MKYLLGISFILLLQNCTNAIDFDGNKERCSYSIIELLKLLDLEQEVVKNLHGYVDLLTKKIATLKVYVNSIQYNTSENQTKREEYVLNPLNAFSLMRRTYLDMPKWHRYAKSAIGLDQIEALEVILVKAPNKIDINNTLDSMQRMVETYGLKRNGQLQNGQYDIQFSIENCLALGHRRCHQYDYKETGLWYHQLLSQEYEISNPQNNKLIKNVKARGAQEFYKCLTNTSSMKSQLKTN